MTNDAYASLMRLSASSIFVLRARASSRRSRCSSTTSSGAALEEVGIAELRVDLGDCPHRASADFLGRGGPLGIEVDHAFQRKGRRPRRE